MYNKIVPLLMVLLVLHPITNKATNGEDTNGSKISLRFNPSEGEQYKQLFEMRTNVTVTNLDDPDSKMEQDSEMGTYYTKDIVKEGDPTILNMVYTRMYINDSMLGMEVKIDTDSLELLDTEMKKSMADGFMELINKPIEITVTSNGTVTSSRYLEEGADNSDVQNMSNVSIVFPEQPIAIGDSWHKEDTLVVLEHEYVNHITYTLSKVDNGVAYITVSGKTVADPNSTKTTYDEIDLKRTQSGIIKIEIVTGWTINSRMEQTMSYVTDEFGDKYVTESTSFFQLRNVE